MPRQHETMKGSRYGVSTLVLPHCNVSPSTVPNGDKSTKLDDEAKAGPLTLHPAGRRYS